MKMQEMLQRLYKKKSPKATVNQEFVNQNAIAIIKYKVIGVQN